MPCLQCSLQDIFRNQSVSSDVEAVELACDGVIMDMAYCPERFVIFMHHIYSSVTLPLCVKLARTFFLVLVGG